MHFLEHLIVFLITRLKFKFHKQLLKKLFGLESQLICAGVRTRGQLRFPVASGNAWPLH